MRISLRHYWTLSNHNIQLKDQDWLFEHDTEVKKLLATNKLYLANILFIFQKRRTVKTKITLGHAAQASYIYI